MTGPIGMDVVCISKPQSTDFDFYNQLILSKLMLFNHFYKVNGFIFLLT